MGCKWELILEEKEAPLLICDQNLNNCCQGLTELSGHHHLFMQI